MTKDNGFGSIGTSSKFQKIAVGQSHTFHVVGKITEEERVWEGGRPRPPRDTDDPTKDIKKTFNFTMVGADGTETTYPATYGFMKAFRAAVEAVDGTLTSHKWKVIRGGELTKPVYVFENLGPVGEAPKAVAKVVAKPVTKAAVAAAIAAKPAVLPDPIAARKAAIAAKKAAEAVVAPDDLDDEAFMAEYGDAAE